MGTAEVIKYLDDSKSGNQKAVYQTDPGMVP